MPARIVLVHDDPRFVKEAEAAIRAAGFDVVAFTDSMTAISALEAAQNAELLITRVIYPPGTPSGISLARMAMYKRPGIKVLFTALAETREYTEGLGEFMQLPVRLPALVDAVRRLLDQVDRPATPVAIA